MPGYMIVLDDKAYNVYGIKPYTKINSYALGALMGIYYSKI